MSEMISVQNIYKNGRDRYHIYTEWGGRGESLSGIFDCPMLAISEAISMRDTYCDDSIRIEVVDSRSDNFAVVWTTHP